MPDKEYSDFVKQHIYLTEKTLEELKRGEITMPTIRPLIGASLNKVPDDSIIDDNSSFGKIRIKSKYHLLTEAYIKTPKLECLEYIKAIQSYFLGNLNEKCFNSYCEKKGIGLELLNGEGLLGGYFSIGSAKIIIQMTNDIKLALLLANDSMLNDIADEFWINFTHEDTHRQQFDKSKKAFKNYRPSTLRYWDEDFSKDFIYFNQKVEADAYGREIGARLSEYYKRFKDSNNVSLIFKDIINNNVDDAYSKKIINVYRDPRIDRDTMKNFYRALYDFLEGNEKQD